MKKLSRKILPLCIFVIFFASLFVWFNCNPFTETTYTQPDTNNDLLDVTDTARASVSGTANLTVFESYPDPGSDECLYYNGCLWAGQFAFVDGVMSESWVQSHNIIAVHSKDAGTLGLKTLRITQGSREITGVVYDYCSDSDCSGCCTDNLGGTGYLIDLEKYTAQRFGSTSGTVNWECLDCN